MHERAAELDPLLHAVRERADVGVAVGLELEELDDLLAPRDGCSISSRLALPNQIAPAEEAGGHPLVAAEHQVVDDVEVGEQAEVLERAGDAERSAGVGPAADELGALEPDRSRLRPVHAVEAVEDARLAGAVRADDGEQFAVVDVERHLVESGDAAEAERHLLGDEQRTASRFDGGHPAHRFFRR